MQRLSDLLRRLAAAFSISVVSVSVLLLAGPAGAQTPSPWAVGMQTAYSPVKREINALNDMVFIIIALICAFVGGLMVWAIWRYRASRNPVPMVASHHTVLEVAWTVLPILILVLIAIPSFRLIYYQDKTKDPYLTIKATGHQWYWEYTYPDQKNLDFSSYIIPDDKLKPGQLRLLAVDNELVLPVGKDIRILTTSGDVIHSFFIPALGVQRYAIPGRTIETWVRIDAPGVYYGECNQICGTNHSRMPIAVRGVSVPDFQAWVVKAQKQYAERSTEPGDRAGSVLALATAQEIRR